MDKNDQINKFVEFSKEIIKTEGINEETLSKISKELSKLSNIEDLFRFGNHRGEVQMQLNRMYCTKMQIPMAQFSN